MSGKRKAASPYPPRVYAKRNSLFYFPEGGRWKKICDGTEWTPDAAASYSAMLWGPVIKGSFAELCEEYKCSPYWRDKSERTKRDNLEEFRRLCLVFGRMRPSAITSEHVGAYKHKRGAKARVRCNRELSLLRALFAYALEGGWVKINVAIGIKPWKELPRDRLILDDEYAAFKVFAHERGESSRVCVAAMDLAYLTTQRRSDVLRIKLQDICDIGIKFKQGKTGQEVTVKWTDRLRAAVDYAKSVRTVARLSPYLFCNRKGEPYTESGIQSLWQRLQVAWQQAGHVRFRFHDTRARGISKLKEAGRQAREISGHKTEQTAERIYDRRKQRTGDAVE